jgi:Zn-dependent membrane protease YugP
MFSQLSGAFLIGIVLLALGVLFQVVTLPVEFNASSRALKQITTLGIINSNEHVYAKRVLNAAALTYVAAAAVAVAELLRLILIYTGMTRSDD